MPSAPTVALLGDVMLGRKVAEAIASAAPEDLWAPEVRDLCQGCDLLVANLECCVSDRGEPTARIPGKPFFFRAPPAAVRALTAIGADAVSLANNHALDFETEALLDTPGHLERAGIATAGAGPDPESARRGTVVEGGGLRLGVVAVSDHPKAFATEPGRPGIAWADLRRGVPEWLREGIARLRGECDAVLAFPHWGPNMTVRPAGWQRRAARELLRAGADLVAGHSAHVFHGAAWEHGGLTLYDLGDALDDYAVDDELRNDLGVLALWRAGGEPELELAGLRLDYCVTRIAEGGDADWIAARLERACGELGTAVERTGEARFTLAPAER
jgi:poly-gamma-glutamate capsule biosynthesis protein CapA/YwtB (metallophosphatase superfamily)